MRKITVTEFLSLDGVMEAPEKWVFPYQSEDVAQAIEDQAFAAEALLLGRVTYEIFAAYWPNYQGKKDARIADRMNSQPKYVVSTTLEKAEWNNTRILRDNFTEDLKQLKQQPGGDISLIGSASLAQSLMKADLIDEYQLMVHPIALGHGKRLFEEGFHKTPLSLVDCRSFRSGVLKVTYRVEHPSS